MTVMSLWLKLFYGEDGPTAVRRYSETLTIQIKKLHSQFRERNTIFQPVINMQQSSSGLHILVQRNIIYSPIETPLCLIDEEI